MSSTSVMIKFIRTNWEREWTQAVAKWVQNHCYTTEGVARLVQKGAFNLKQICTADLILTVRRLSGYE
jgi:hypothetical protein